MLKKVDGSQASISGWQQTGKSFEVSWEDRLFILTNFHQCKHTLPSVSTKPVFVFYYVIEARLFYSVVLISAVQQSGSVICAHTLSHNGLSQGTDSSSRRHTGGPDLVVYPPCIVCLCQSQTPTHPSPDVILNYTSSIFRFLEKSHKRHLHKPTPL